MPITAKSTLLLTGRGSPGAYLTCLAANSIRRVPPIPAVQLLRIAVSDTYSTYLHVQYLLFICFRQSSVPSSSDTT